MQECKKVLISYFYFIFLGGANDNPSEEEFQRNFNALNVAGSNLIKIYGNSRGRDREDVRLDVNDRRQLPKRAKR